ncbi:MAG: PH domain-containing protein [Rhodoglobus sp.]
MATDSANLHREATVARIHSHARALIFPHTVLVATAGAFGYFGGRFDQQWQNGAVLVAALGLIVFAWLWPLLGWLSRNYTITTRRVVLSRGIFVRVRQELLLSRGFDVTVRQSWPQALFGSGDLLINADHDHSVVLRDIPAAIITQAALHDLMETNGYENSLGRQSDDMDDFEQGGAQQARSLSALTSRKKLQDTGTDVTTVWGTR